MRKLVQKHLNKLTEKQVVQNIIIEVVADLIMVAVGIVLAYYIKVQVF
ncbi:hypothetical protein P4U99_22985 [Brevibacillus agri]|nr:hypothetical protein [Brevibacillus agri]MED1656330.1 hypothetical protein [Brevibacillus agri]MED1689252.1 hypothetical protein [Brevibacillus agri]MED1693775.1 hypothetical protein [Brevibacillus agri]MED1699115.1 hypothetical protein [Brevibacillus agri]